MELQRTPRSYLLVNCDYSLHPLVYMYMLDVTNLGDED